MEYAATITVNPSTAFRMLQDFVKLNPGALFASLDPCFQVVSSFP